MSQQEIVSQVQAWLRAHESEMLADYRAMLQIPSLEDAPQPNAPFGAENRRALDLALDWARRAGMETTDMEGYCGYADFGSGRGLVMTLGHLDVVPVGPGWKHEPFGAEVDDGYVYARGANDDKGPTVAMFYAARAVKECWPDVPVRIRSLFGCNEESGFQCVAHYMKTGEHPTLGVAPDAGWPCIHGEKGISNLIVAKPLPTGDLTVLELSGGQRPNIVIDSFLARVRVAAGCRPAMEMAVAESWDKNLSFGWEGDVIAIRGTGKAAHGANPFAGDSAAIRVLRFLKEHAPLAQQREFEAMHELLHIGGDGVGISGSDEPSGPLTLNCGVVETAAGEALFTLNVRYPVTWDGSELKARAEKHLGSLPGGFRLAEFSDSKPLYFPLDHPLVKAVTEVYSAETGEDKKPGTMGGGTYARAIPNCVAIGTGWDGDGPAHETDERLAISSLNKMAQIYGHLLVRLAREAAKLV
ncbi:MAG: Sapep family Mn(2+)-dependent dipeptidase [Armatimonadetes bacterium]|nr:Sapep family Mn(2+)-dependent dipeptidase [Armatimonadota bacterium]MBS1710313.1 Sapep family Mn(2+)-dependent dipeptidase [Armatimonadota bacterium]MBX3109050.1 Sapep family Mn(2+)-dependent dipeptidase [Fimbriimonadaceae bacterium]